MPDARQYQDPLARTLPSLLQRAAAEWRDKPLVIFPDAVVTYRDLAERARAFAGGLQRLGVRQGDTVLIIAGNRWEYLEAWWGTCLCGAVEVPVNFGLKGRLLQHVLVDSQARVAIVAAEYLPALEAVLGEVPAIETLIIIGDSTRAVAGRRLLGFDEVPRGEADLPAVRYGDLACIMYTSGSTGPAKGAMLSHNYFLRFAEEKARHVRTGPRDVLHNCYPLFNASGQLEAVMTAMTVGASVYQARRFSASRFWEEVRRYGCTEFIYMGGILSILDKATPKADDANNTVRAGYGVPTPPDLHPRFEQRFGCVLVEVYGSTEANTVTFNPYDARKWGSCGLPTAGYDVLLVDDDDNEVGTGEIGELLVRPRRAHSVFEGYWGLPEKTVAAFRGLWYRTGDLLRRDEDGYFFFVARKSETIRHHGYMVSPSQIEDVVREFDGVLECAAVGVPDERAEEDIKLLLVPQAAHTLDVERIRRQCEQDLPSWMVPRYLEVRSDLPKTPTQKVEKFRLKREGIGPATKDLGPFRRASAS
jgi:carnitine-CoA ligase